MSARLRRPRLLARAALLACALGTGACDRYVSGVQDDPNAVSSASAAQLFTSIQLNTWLLNEGQVARLSSIWLNQQAGIERQFLDLDVYRYGEDVASTEMSDLYVGGGLRDIRLAKAQTDSLHWARFNAVLKIHEAFLFGTAASVWGDIPYSGAGGGPDHPQSPLDRQQDVYAAVQSLLDQAIAQLAQPASTTETVQLGNRDFVFGHYLAELGGTAGPAKEAEAWMAVAWSLKARLYMHWVEAQSAGLAAASTACGGDCLAKALAAAQNGISSSSGNWTSVHSSASNEANWFFQFSQARAGDVGAGRLMVDLLSSRNDPRLALYFQPVGGAFVGSMPGESNGAASPLNTGAGGIAAAAAGLPLVSCAETQLILAEARDREGQEATANDALHAAIACEDARLGVAIPMPPTLSGAALFQEIATQKYIALFLNPEAWNDYKRNCLPNVAALVKPAGSPVHDVPIPARLLYGQAERQSNPNVPPPERQPARNTNDPVPCSQVTGLPGA